MFFLTQPSPAEAARQIVIESGRSPLAPQFISAKDGLRGEVPRGFAHDLARIQLGAGRQAFEDAKRGFEQWEQFDLGWVRVTNKTAEIKIGNIIAVEVHSLGLWSLNLSQIVEVIREPFAFGFTYKTTPQHVEEGEERFLLTLNPYSGAVWYELEAVSIPHSVLARLCLPVTRFFQHRFARGSQQRMMEIAQSVRSGSGRRNRP